MKRRKDLTVKGLELREELGRARKGGGSSEEDPSVRGMKEGNDGFGPQCITSLNVVALITNNWEMR